ncbi:MAG: diacylglycerol kinase family protein [Planctomycetaceae bacterium]
MMQFLKRRLLAFRWAGRGVVVLFRTQVHAWIHLLATLLVTAAGWELQISRSEWMLVILVIGLVWATEAMNTAIESAVDLASPDRHPLAAQAKDAAAAAVLLAAITAALIGAIIFLPRLSAERTSSHVSDSLHRDQQR